MIFYKNVNLFARSGIHASEPVLHHQNEGEPLNDNRDGAVQTVHHQIPEPDQGDNDDDVDEDDVNV